MHQIENDFLRVKARNFGAELISVFNKKTKTEHLWQADEKFWAWHAPVLFPVIGRCRNDEIIIDGAKYAMQKHGFARKSNFELRELSETKMIFALASSEETLKIFPYRFELLLGYRVKENKLVCSYEIINRDKKIIYFQLGGHPAFAVPFHANENYEDYFLEFEKEENSPRYFIDENGFFNGEKDLILNNTNKISLRKNLFKDDALIFKNLKSRSVSIKSKNHSHALTVDFPAFNYLGVWAKENAPYVCIEPWLGCADTANISQEFSVKEGIIKLPAKEKFNVSFDVKII